MKDKEFINKLFPLTEEEAFERNKREWVINFAETSDGQVTIKNNSTACVIEIIANDDKNLGPYSLFLSYNEFDSLVRCIKNIKR